MAKFTNKITPILFGLQTVGKAIHPINSIPGTLVHNPYIYSFFGTEYPPRIRVKYEGGNNA
jgi:hypothetical protein